MANCYLIMTSETGDRLRPCLFVAVAEDEADAIDAFVRGFSDYMALGETASIAGRCEPVAARKMGRAAGASRLRRATRAAPAVERTARRHGFTPSGNHPLCAPCALIHRADRSPSLTTASTRQSSPHLQDAAALLAARGAGRTSSACSVWPGTRLRCSAFVPNSFPQLIQGEGALPCLRQLLRLFPGFEIEGCGTRLIASSGQVVSHRPHCTAGALGEAQHRIIGIVGERAGWAGHRTQARQSVQGHSYRSCYFGRRAAPSGSAITGWRAAAHGGSSASSPGSGARACPQARRTRRGSPASRRVHRRSAAFQSLGIVGSGSGRAFQGHGRSSFGDRVPIRVSRGAPARPMG